MTPFHLAFLVRDLDETRRFGDRQSPFHGLSDHVPLIGRFSLK